METLIKNIFSFCTMVLMGYSSFLFYAEQLHTYVCIYIYDSIICLGKLLMNQILLPRHAAMTRSDLRAVKRTELRKQVQDYFIVIYDVSCHTFSYMSLFFQTVNNI